MQLFSSHFFVCLFLLQAVCVTVAVLMQYFLMAAFCWMLVEGIYLYLFVVKVYNINTKMHMYHVMSWGIFLLQLKLSYTVVNHFIHSCIILIPLFGLKFRYRPSHRYGSHFIEHLCWKRRNTELYQ